MIFPLSGPFFAGHLFFHGLTPKKREQGISKKADFDFYRKPGKPQTGACDCVNFIQFINKGTNKLTGRKPKKSARSAPFYQRHPFIIGISVPAFRTDLIINCQLKIDS